MAVVSLIRSSVINNFKYVSMLAGNPARNNAAMFHVGGTEASGGLSVLMHKMLYLTETLTSIPAVLTTVTFRLTNAAFTNGRISGYRWQYNSYTDKFNLTTELNSTLGFYNTIATWGSYRGGTQHGVAGYFFTFYSNTASDLRIMSYSNDSLSLSTAMRSFTNIGTRYNYTFSNGASIYFGGGDTTGSTLGGLVRYNATADTGTSLWASNYLPRQITGGAENGTVSGYLAGGWTGSALPTSIHKVNFASDGTASAISGVLSTSRNEVRVGQSNGVCAYYVSGRATAASISTVLQSTDKLTYSTDTVSSVSIGTITLAGLNSYNMV